jgi:hypothetical protein
MESNSSAAYLPLDPIELIRRMDPEILLKIYRGNIAKVKKCIGHRTATASPFPLTWKPHLPDMYWAGLEDGVLFALCEPVFDADPPVNLYVPSCMTDIDLKGEGKVNYEKEGEAGGKKRRQ